MSLNNPQSIPQASLLTDNGAADPGASPSPGLADEESFMPADQVRIRPSTDRTRINSSLTFSAEGGTSPYLFALEDGSGVLNPNTGSFTAPSSPGHAVVGARDELGTSDRATVLFKDPPALTPTPTSIAVGNTLRIGAAGGTRPYSYAITAGNDFAVYNSDTGILTAIATGVTTLTLTDLDGETASLALTIVPALALSASSTTLGFGATQALTTAGGVSPISYRVAAGAGAVSGASDSGVTYTAPSNTGASVVEAKDALGNTAIVLLEITPPLLISPSRVLVPVGQSRELTASGGSAPYTFSTPGGSGSVNQSGVTATFTAPSSPGTTTVTVTDSKGLTATADIITHATLAFALTGADVTVGQTVQLAASGGVPALSYSIVSGAGSISTTGLYTAPTTPGTAVIRVTDSATPSANWAEMPVRILSELTLSPATLTVMSGAAANLGATGGLPPYSYAVLSGGTATGTVHATTGAFTAGAAAGTLQVQVTDSRGSTATSTLTVVATLAFSPPTQTVTPGSVTAISTTGGLAPITLSLSAGPGSLSGANFTAPAGNGVSVLKAQDALGNITFATLTTQIPLSIIPSTIELPGSGSLTFTADGGTPPYSYSLGSGSLGNIAPTSGLFLAPPGSGSAQVVVTDASGTTATATIGVLPDIRITSPATGTVAATGVTLAGSCEIGIPVAMGGSGTTGTLLVDCLDGTFSSFVSFTTGDGTKTLSASQSAGSLTGSVSRDFERRSPLPTGTSITLAAGATHTRLGTVDVTLTATDAADVYLTEVAGCASGGSWQSFGTNKSYSFAARNSTVTIYAKFRNAELAEGSCISDTIIHDDILPTLAVTSPASGALSQGSISVTGTCEAGLDVVVAGSGVTSAGAIACASAGSFSGSFGLSATDGAKTVTYTQTDAAGNATTITHTYTRDATAPAAPGVSPADGTSVGATSTITGSCDTGTALIISGTGISGGPHSLTCTSGSYSQAISLTAGGGTKAFTVSSTDAAGNSSSTSSTLVRDVTGPALTQTALSDGAQVGSTAALSGECEDGGGSVSITGSGLLTPPETASCNIGAWSKTVTLSAGEGSKSLTITQDDPVGNSTSLTLGLTSDRTAPTSPSVVIGGADPTNSISVELTLGASEAPAQMYITQAADCTSGGSWEAFSATKTWTLSSANASNTVRAKFRDAAGNETSCTSDSVTHDSIAPTVAITSPAAGTIDPNGLTISGTCDSGVSVLLSGGVTSNVTTSCTSGAFSAAVTFSAGAGAKSIVASQTDAAGNSGSDSRSFTRSASSRIYASASLAPADNLAEVLIFAVPTNASGNYINGASVQISASPTTNIIVSSGHATPDCSSATAYCKKGLEVGDGIYMVRARVAAAGTGTSYTFSATVTGTPSGSVTGTAAVLFKTADFVTLTTGTTIDNSATYVNKNLYLTAGTITFGASSVGQTYGHLFVRGTATIAVPASTTSATTPLDISVSSFHFQSGTFNVNDRGYPAGYSYGATGPSTSLVPNSNSVGASHGGLGGKSGSTDSGPVYGNYRNPVHPGSGAGTGGSGIGGGAIRIQSTEGCALSASISATKSTGNVGSGGSINFRCGSIYLASGQTLNVNGSAGSTTIGGAAGGRIALVTTADAKSLSGAAAYPDTTARLTTFTSAVQARGGVGSFGNSRGSGAAGTIYIKHANLTHGDLLIDNGCGYQVGDLSGKTRLPSLAGTISAISGNAITLTPSADSILNANTTNLYQGLRVRGDISIDNGTPSDWSDDALLEVASNSSTTLTMTSAPAAEVAVSDTLRSIDVLDHLEVSGCALLETAGDLYIRSGSISNPDQPQLTMTNGRLLLLGAASSSLTTSNSFSSGTWTFSSAQSWSALTISGGTINTQGLTTTTGGLTVSGGTLTNTGTLTSAGTYAQSGGAVTTDNLTASQSVNLSGGTLTAKTMNVTGNLALSGAAILTHPAPTTSATYSLDATVAGAISLTGTSRISADGKGYLNGYGFGATPQEATAPHAWNGGSHGGTGGLDTAYPGTGSNKVPLVHGDYRNPRLPGCGTGATSSGYANGGGVISLTAGGVCTIDSGTAISADFESGPAAPMAAGGSIRLQCGGFAGTGGASAISAKGGGTGSATAGGGGRIALISTGNSATFGGSFPWPADASTLATLTSSVKANGGLGADSKGGDGHGGAGSVFLQHSYNPASPPATGGTLIYDNGRSGSFQVSLRSGVSSLRSLAGTITAISADRTTLTVRIDTGTANYNLFSGAFANVFTGVRLRPDISNDANANNSIVDDETVTITANTNLTYSGGLTTTTLTVSPAVSGAVAINDQFRSIDIVDRFYVGGGGIFQTAGDLVISDRIVDAPDGTSWTVAAAITQLLGSASMNITPSYTFTTGSYHLGSYQLAGDMNATNLTWSSTGTLSAPNLAIHAGGSLTQTTGTIDITNILSSTGNLTLAGTLNAPTITSAGNYSQTAGTVTTRTMAITGDLSLSGSAKLTHTANGDNAPVQLLDAAVGGNFTMSGTSLIDAKGKGHIDGDAYGFATQLQSILGSAASHGGMGGWDDADATSAQIGPTYDDYRDPALPGAGDSYTGSNTTTGGGVVRIQATGSCAFNDSATIDAESGGYSTGYRSAGGSIKLACGSFGGTASGLILKAGAGSSPSGEPGGGGGRVALISTGNATSFSGALPWPGSASGDSTTLTTLLARVRVTGATADGNNGDGGAGTLFLKHSGLTHGALIVNNGSAAPALVQRSGTTRLPSLTGTITAISADRLTLTIGSTVPYTLTAYYADLFRGMRIRPSVSYDGGTPNDWSDDEIRTVVSNTQTTLTLNAPVHSSVTVGATFRSIDILDHIELSGGAVLESHGDIYITSGPLLDTGATSWNLTQGVLSLGGSAGINLLPTLQLASGTWYVRPQSASGAVTHSSTASVTFDNLSISSGGFSQSAGSVTLNGAASIAGGVNLSGGTLTAETLTITSGNLALSSSAALTHPVSSGNGASIKRLSITLPAGGLTLSGTSRINADAKGWNGNTYFSTDDIFDNATASAAAHGGSGGKQATLNTLAASYGDFQAPAYPGGGRKAATAEYGGGVVAITAADACTINTGTSITANGNAAGSAGGSIHLQCSGFAGTAGSSALTANGGAATGSGMGGGGGGRIALISTGDATSFSGSFAYPSGSTALAAFKGVVKATGGAGHSTPTGDGGAGTIYLKHSGLSRGDLIIDNGKSSTNATLGGTTPFFAATDNAFKIYSRVDTNTVNVTNGSTPYTNRLNYYAGLWIHIDPVTGYTADPLDGAGHTFIRLTGNGSNTFITDSGTFPAISSSNYFYRFVTRLNHLDIAGFAQVSFASGDLVLDSGCDLHSSSSSAFDVPTGSAISGGNTFASQTCRTAERTGTTTFTTTVLAP